MKTTSPGRARTSSTSGCISPHRYIGLHFAALDMTPALIESARRCEGREWSELLKNAFRLVGEPARDPLLELRKPKEDP